jgi:hypothetical protein
MKEGRETVNKGRARLKEERESMGSRVRRRGGGGGGGGKAEDYALQKVQITSFIRHILEQYRFGSFISNIYLMYKKKIT